MMALLIATLIGASPDDALRQLEQQTAEQQGKQEASLAALERAARLRACPAQRECQVCAPCLAPMIHESTCPSLPAAPVAEQPALWGRPVFWLATVGGLALGLVGGAAIVGSLR